MPIQRAKPRFTEVKNVSNITANQLDIGQIGGRRNIAYNGAMNIAQRGTSRTGVTNGANQGYQTVDRITTAGNSNGVFTMTQTADGPDGFANCLKLDCTTADTSIAASEYFLIEQKLEGQDLQQLNYNQSSAKTSTISFYVKGNASAQYTFALQYHLSGGTARWFTKGFAVTTDWTRVVITIPGDTQASSGSDYGIADDTATGANLMIWFHGGTNFSSGTHQDTAWADRDYTKLFQDNQTSFSDSTDRTFFITGLQMEVGSQATPFEHRSFGEELFLCQRYFRDLCSGINGSVLSLVTHYASTNAVGTFVLSPEMRTTPTAIAVSSASHFTTYSAAAARVCSALQTDSFAPNIARMTATISSITAGYSGWIQPNTTSATMHITAEL